VALMGGRICGERGCDMVVPYRRLLALVLSEFTASNVLFVA